jgi:putative ABC transport system permease protein
MIKNYFKIAWRNLWKDKQYSFLNIFGLTIGITFSLFLILYVIDELSYDKHHEKAQQIYRVVSYVNEPEKAMKWANTQAPLAQTLKQDYPEIQQVVRFVKADKVAYIKGTKQFKEEKIFYTDSAVFNVFTYSFIEGSPTKALSEPNSLVLTEALAIKYFGNVKGILGESIKDSRGEVFKITGVVKNSPPNSHLIADGFISASSLPKDFANSWGQFGRFYTYVLLSDKANAAAFEKKLLPIYDKYMAQIFAQFNIKVHYGLQAITAIHLSTDFDNEPGESGSMSYVYIFSLVALFMLVIASINYMNLTTARSMRRAKEIGIRKVSGSQRWQLISQFLVESITITLIALVISLVLVVVLLPIFNEISGKFFTFYSVIQPKVLAFLLGIIFLVGFIGGTYPAFYLTRFNPVTVLKGRLLESFGNVGLRRVLVTTQFTISMVMIICTWVVFDQLQFMKKKDLGFNKEQVLSIKIDPQISSDTRVLKTEVLAQNNIVSASLSEAVPGSPINFNLFTIETKNGFVDKGVEVYGIDEDYCKTLGISLIKGRNFSFNTPADTLNSVIVNEAMVKEFEWDTPLGKKIKFPGDTSGRYWQVVGVVKDFNQKSLYNPMQPLIMFYNPRSAGLQVKLNPADINNTLAKIESIWKKWNPNTAFEYTFLDQAFNSQFEADQKRAKIFTSFSILTVLISCLGLLGLVAFTTQQRQKEISIRKVVGASVFNIIPLIIKNFIFLVGIACLIAFPIAYYFMHKWLQTFPYRTDLKASIFIVSAVIVLFITFATVSFHAIKAAITNPIKSLRTE